LLLYFHVVKVMFKHYNMRVVFVRKREGEEGEIKRVRWVR